MAKFFNWDVTTESVHDMYGHPINGYNRIVKTDSGSTLNVAKDSYYPIYNSVFEDVVGTLVEDLDCTVTSQGEFRGGRWIYTQFENDEFLNTVIPGDKHGEIKGYGTLVNSHDGSLAFRFYIGMVRIWCQNTFMSSYSGKDNRNGLSVKHTRNHRDKIDSFSEKIVDIKNAQQDIYKTMEEMTNKVNWVDPFEFTKELYNLEMKPRPINKRVNGVNERIGWTHPKYSSRGENLMEQYANTYDRYNEIEHNNWRMFNTTTDIIDHQQSTAKMNKGYSMFGGGNDVKVRAFKLLSS